MKLIGTTNGEKVIASVHHHDYNSIGEGEKMIMVDGGQPSITGHYMRWSGKIVWFEVPQTLAELYNDYREKYHGQGRKYGIWNLDEVRILTLEEYPNTNSFEWQAENAIWGTRGMNDDQPLKYIMLGDCSTEHLIKIKELCEIRGKIDFIQKVDYWLAQKCK